MVCLQCIVSYLIFTQVKQLGTSVPVYTHLYFVQSYRSIFSRFVMFSCKHTQAHACACTLLQAAMFKLIQILFKYCVMRLYDQTTQRNKQSIYTSTLRIYLEFAVRLFAQVETCTEERRPHCALCSCAIQLNRSGIKQLLSSSFLPRGMIL